MPVLDQLTVSNLSLDGPTGLSARIYGYFPQPSPVDGTTATSLHRDYSIFSNPGNTSIKNFNGTVFNKPESNLDETDPIAPQNLTGIQVYKSTTGQNYKDLGPVDGHF